MKLVYNNGLIFLVIQQYRSDDKSGPNTLRKISHLNERSHRSTVGGVIKRVVKNYTTESSKSEDIYKR